MEKMVLGLNLEKAGFGHVETRWGGNGISQDRVDHTKTMKDRSGCGGINEISRSGIRLRWVWGVTTVKDLECLLSPPKAWHVRFPLTVKVIAVCLLCFECKLAHPSLEEHWKLSEKLS